jgi:hypothetical protein
MRESTMRAYAADAGFGGFELREPPELEMLRLYLLSAG